MEEKYFSFGCSFCVCMLVLSLFLLAIPNLYKLLRAQTDEEKEQHRAATRESLASLNSSLKRQSEGPFFLGDRLSLADISLVPFLDRFVATLEYYRDFVVLPEVIKFILNSFFFTSEI